jgi:hypothetical protein
MFPPVWIYMSNSCYTCPVAQYFLKLIYQYVLYDYLAPFWHKEEETSTSTFPKMHLNLNDFTGVLSFVF